jgi:hypothetical protein
MVQSEPDLGSLRPTRAFITDDETEALALIELQRHLVDFNRRFGKHWSLIMPKRGVLKSSIVGRASDKNHLLYQCHVDLILAKCPRPITKEAIRVILVADGEKPSTARLLAGDYFKMITAVLDPETKLHREAARSITTWGNP